MDLVVNGEDAGVNLAVVDDFFTQITHIVRRLGCFMLYNNAHSDSKGNLDQLEFCPIGLRL